MRGNRIRPAVIKFCSNILSLVVNVMLIFLLPLFCFQKMSSTSAKAVMFEIKAL